MLLKVSWCDMRKTFKRYSIFIIALAFLLCTFYIWNASNSVKISYTWRSFNSIKIVKDEHVVPYEKVFVLVNGDTNDIDNVDLVLTNNRVSFKVNIKDLKEEKPYFELPYYNNNIIVGSKYFIKEVLINYVDGEKTRITTDVNASSHLLIDEREEYFVVEDDDIVDANAWRDFNSITIKDRINSNGNIYLNINGDTKEMVDIELEWVKKDETSSFLVNVESLDNRPFFNISDIPVKLGEEYYLKEMKIFYNNGGHYIYNADNYANILNNRIFINSLAVNDSKNIEAESIVDENYDKNAINNNKRSESLAGGMIVLFLIFVVAFGVFIFLKDEDR